MAKKQIKTRDPTAGSQNPEPEEARSIPKSSPPHQSFTTKEASLKVPSVVGTEEGEDEPASTTDPSILLARDPKLQDTSSSASTRNEAKKDKIEDEPETTARIWATDPMSEPVSETDKTALDALEHQEAEKEGKPDKIVGTPGDTTADTPVDSAHPSDAEVTKKSGRPTQVSGATNIARANKPLMPKSRSSNIKKPSPITISDDDNEQASKEVVKPGKKKRLAEGDTLTLEAAALPFDLSDKSAKRSTRTKAGKQKAQLSSPDAGSDYEDGDSPDQGSDFELDNLAARRRASHRAKIPSEKKRTAQEAGLAGPSKAAKKVKGKPVVEAKKKTKQSAAKPAAKPAANPAANPAADPAAPMKKSSTPKTASAKIASIPLPPKSGLKTIKLTPGTDVPAGPKSKHAVAEVEKNAVPEGTALHPKPEKPFHDDCRSQLQANAYKFNVDDAELRSKLKSLLEETEALFIETEAAEYQQQMSENFESYCRQLVRDLPSAARLIVRAANDRNFCGVYQELVTCLNPQFGKSRPRSWQIVHGLFLAFLTSEVLQKATLFMETGLEDLASASTIRKYHLHLESTDPKRAKIHRMRWRQYLHERTDDTECQRKCSNLADHLTEIFSKGARCFLATKDQDKTKDANFKNKLKGHVLSAIRLRIRLSLSSFKYTFSWIPSGEVFDPERMETPLDEQQGTQIHLSNVRFARSPLVHVERPKGDNEWAREACEFRKDEFEAPILVARADVVCFDGRVAPTRHSAPP